MICRDDILHNEPNRDEQRVSKKVYRTDYASHLVQSFSEQVMLLPGALSYFRLGVLLPQLRDFLLSFAAEFFFLTEVPLKYFFKKLRRVFV